MNGEIPEKQTANGTHATRRMALLVFLCFLVFVIGVFGFLVLRSYLRVRSSINLSQYNDPSMLTRSTNTSLATTGAIIQIETSDDPTIGSDTAKVSIVEFGDFECPYCQQSFMVVKDLLAKYKGKIRFQFRDFPNTSLHPSAFNAALAARCANAQGKFWEYHDLLYIGQDALDIDSLVLYAEQVSLEPNAFRSCVITQQYAADVRKDASDGSELGVEGTPTWFINGHRIEGAVPLDIFKKIVDYGLKGKL